MEAVFFVFFFFCNLFLLLMRKIHGGVTAQAVLESTAKVSGV